METVCLGRSSIPQLKTARVLAFQGCAYYLSIIDKYSFDLLCKYEYRIYVETLVTLN